MGLPREGFCCVGIAVKPARKFDRITHDAAVMGGKTCIHGLRVTVGLIVGLVAQGRTKKDILADYPYHTVDWKDGRRLVAFGLKSSYLKILDQTWTD